MPTEKRRLSEVIAVRAEPGFLARLRAAAAAEGLKTGDMVRAALVERIGGSRGGRGDLHAPG